MGAMACDDRAYARRYRQPRGKSVGLPPALEALSEHNRDGSCIYGDQVAALELELWPLTVVPQIIFASLTFIDRATWSELKAGPGARSTTQTQSGEPSGQMRFPNLLLCNFTSSLEGYARQHDRTSDVSDWNWQVRQGDWIKWCRYQSIRTAERV